MTISGANYSQPVEVNGYMCRNCTDVDNAKKHIDPAHPQSGPYGVDAASDPTRAAQQLGTATNLQTQAKPSPGTGVLLDVSA